MTEEVEWVVKMQAVTEAEIYIYATDEEDARTQAEDVGFEKGDIVELTDFEVLSIKRAK